MTDPYLTTYKSATDCLALHLGRWDGIFREYEPHPQGQLISQKRSIITFTQPEPGSIHQTNAYLPIEADPRQFAGSGDSMGWLYRNYAAGLRFFAEGSFSNGRVQLAPFSDFGVEQGFVRGDQKVRIVRLFDDQGSLSRITTILETRGSLPELDPPFLDPEQLVGSWHAQATTFRADEYLPTQTTVTLQISQPPSFVLPGSLWIEGPTRLPIPTQHSDRSFQVTLGWIPEPGSMYQLTRRYDQAGAWAAVTLVMARRDPP